MSPFSSKFVGEHWRIGPPRNGIEQRKGHRERSVGAVGQLVHEVKFPDINERVMQSAVGAAGSMVVHVFCFGNPEDAGSLTLVVIFLTLLGSVSIETLVAVIDP